MKCPIAECFYVRAAPLVLTPFSFHGLLPEMPSAFAGNKDARTSFRRLGRTAPRHWPSKLLVKAATSWPRSSRSSELLDIDPSGRRGLRPDLGRSTPQPALCHHGCLRGADRIRAARAGGRGGGVVVWVASWALGRSNTLSPSHHHRGLCCASGVFFVWLGVAVSMDPDHIATPLDIVFRAIRWIAAAA